MNKKDTNGKTVKCKKKKIFDSVRFIASSQTGINLPKDTTNLNTKIASLVLNCKISKMVFWYSKVHTETKVMRKSFLKILLKDLRIQTDSVMATLTNFSDVAKRTLPI